MGGAVQVPGTDVTFVDDGPLAGLVTAYLCQMHGFIEIASRGIKAQSEMFGPDGNQEAIARLRSEGDHKYADAYERVVTGGKTALISDMVLARRGGAGLQVDVDQLAGQVVRNHGPAVRGMNPLATGALLIVTWERIRQASTKTPEWEFLRHCRNAAAHNGRFHFLGDEPVLPAAWGGFSLDKQLHGELLFTDGQSDGFLGPGDVICLLADIDRAMVAGAP